MLAAFSMLGRMFRAARVMAAYDVLPPAQWKPLTPPALLVAARLFPRSRTLAQGRSGERLTRALTKLGPSYIKAGQFLATRPDVIGAEIAQDLSELQDRLPPFDNDEANRILLDELGPEKCARLGNIGPSVAAASIAQVHKVHLKPEPDGSAGRTLAVKILRPNVEKEFAADLRAFAWAARQAERLTEEARRLKPRALVETLARSVALEMDLRLEAAAASEMAANISGDPIIRIPAVDWDFTSRRVLATEWIDGTSLRNRDELVARGHDLKALATNLIQAFLKHALRDGFFHADMHPGNLFVDGNGKIVVVDFGIMGRLDKTSRRFMAETLAGFLARDYRRVAEVHLAIGFVPPRHTVEDFAQALRAIGEPIFGRPASNMSMANLLSQLFEVTRLFDMEMQPQLVMLQKTMVVVEGVSRQLDPDHSIWDAARPVIEKWMIDSIGPQARLQDAADGLTALGRALSVLPAALKNAELIAASLTTGGIRIHPDSAQAIGKAQANAPGVATAAFWLSLAALVLAAFAFF
ncbi:MAG: 2-polyprenylphenol 6-hydroxylase [Micropepsaceae bacterium]